MLFIADGDMRQAINNIQACHFAAQGRKLNN
jgi:DNA polymerase III delta prime subunit